jgi:hypothetical protein
MTENPSNIEALNGAMLTAQKLSRQLMGLPAARRLAAVLSHTDAEAVVASLPVQDFFFFVKEIGPDDATSLLALGQAEQLVHLFDLEWWERDDLQPAKALQWLERLASASEEKLLAWLYQADFELLVALFKKWTRVVLTPEDVDPLEASEQLPKHTLDDQFYWETQFLQFEDFLGRLLNLLFEVNSGFYRELMNHVIWASEAEFEEEAARFHRARLQDQAIPDFHDATEIYRALRPGEIGHDKDAAALPGATTSTPLFAVAMLPEKDLLPTALGEIQDRCVIDTLCLELASLANKVVVADRLVLDEPEALRLAVGKVAAYINLGLDILSRGSLKRAVKILEEVFLEHLFRLAHTQIAQLKGRLQRVLQRGWLSRWPAGLKCLDTDWMEAAELLLQKTPRLIRPASGSKPTPEEDFFRERRDLLQVVHFLDVLPALGPLFESLKVERTELSERWWQEGQIRRLEDVTLGVLIWTAAAHFQTSGSWEVAPVKLQRWPEWFGLLGPEVLEQSIRAWVERILSEAQQRDLVAAYLEPLFQEYAQEMAPFLASHPPDPRLVKFFIFEEE